MSSRHKPCPGNSAFSTILRQVELENRRAILLSSHRSNIFICPPLDAQSIAKSVYLNSSSEL